MTQGIAFDWDRIFVTEAPDALAFRVENLHSDSAGGGVGVQGEVGQADKRNRFEGHLAEVHQRLSQSGLDGLGNGAKAGKAIAWHGRQGNPRS